MNTPFKSDKQKPRFIGHSELVSASLEILNQVQDDTFISPFDDLIMD